MSNSIILLVARILLAFIFILSGVQKFFGLEGTAAYISSVGLPFATLLAVGAAIVETFGGLAILVGFRTREAAWVLAAFTLVAGFLFHFDPADQMQMINFMKNIAIAGGFLALGQIGAGAFSLDARRGTATPAYA
jgi:putative oxidoreductase